MPRDIDQRFWEKVKPSGGCLIWTAATDQDGYGLFQVSGRVTRRAHRWIYERMLGPIPDGLKVLHRCDTPSCVNYKACLFIGTTADNNRDRDLKGRQSKGEDHYAAKLTTQQVAEMRERAASGEPIRRFYSEYGISYSHAKNVVSGRKWRT